MQQTVFHGDGLAALTDDLSVHRGIVTADILFSIVDALPSALIALNTIDIGALEQIREQLHELVLLLRGESAPVLAERALRHLVKTKALEHRLANLNAALLRIEVLLGDDIHHVIDSLTDLVQGFTGL